MLKKAFVSILASSCFLSGCQGDVPMDGSFDYVSGNCNSSRIDIKRVKGFGDRYYLVTIYSKKNRGGGSEFLGVIKKRTLTVYRGTKLHGSSMETAGLIVFNSDGISVSTDGKTCIYRRR